MWLNLQTTTNWTSSSCSRSAGSAARPRGSAASAPIAAATSTSRSAKRLVVIEGAADAVLVVVQVLRVGSRDVAADLEVLVRDVVALQPRRRRRDADGRVAVRAEARRRRARVADCKEAARDVVLPVRVRNRRRAAGRVRAPGELLRGPRS